MPFIRLNVIQKGETNGIQKTTTIEILEKKAHHCFSDRDSIDRIHVRDIYPVVTGVTDLARPKTLLLHYYKFNQKRPVWSMIFVAFAS